MKKDRSVGAYTLSLSMLEVGKGREHFMRLTDPSKSPGPSLLLHPRLQLQAAGLAPPTFGKIASFVEQGTSENKDKRTMPLVDAIVAVTRRFSEFSSSQRNLLKESGKQKLIAYLMEVSYS